MKVICIIPARERSSRLRNKNILKIKGKSLVQIALDKSLKIREFEKIIVSTDSRKILNLKKKYKDVIFLKRPMKYATAKSLMGDTINHVINKLQKK